MPRVFSLKYAAPLIWQGVVCAALWLPESAHADWTAFNDQGQTGDAKDTSFTIPALGRSSGALKDIATGKALGASLTITVGGSGKAPVGAPTMAAPSAGTPAYSIFSPFIDWTEGSNPGIYLYPSNVIDYTFSGLDPAQRYRFTGTAVRGGTASTPGDAASNRWTQAELIGVLDYTASHSANTVTSNDFPAALSGSQAAWNAGVNLTGDVVQWDNIAPASNGTFMVRCTKYEGPTPGGNAGNSQESYAYQAIRLDEFTVSSNGPPLISLTSPVDGTLAPLLAPLAVSAATNGQVDVAKVEFYVNGAKIGQATTAPYNFAWAGTSVGTYEYWAVATDTLGLTATSGVAHVTLTNERSGAGTVYLVVGSDTAIWNAGTTVDVYTRYPYYPQDFYTDPSSPSYQVMDPVWRSQFTDSFGQPVKFTWWLMGGNIYRDATNQNVPVPNTMLPYLMVKYHGAALRQFGDELSLHYHTFIWSDYNGDGKFYWNQSRTFEECREDFEYTLAQYLLEEEIFPVSFRSGWHYMDNGWQQELDQLLPYSMHDNWPAYQAWSTSEPIGNVEDWSRAPSVFVPFHPATNDYQVPGSGPGWNVRSIKMQSMAQSDMDTVFARAANGADQVICIWDHLPEAFVANFYRVASFIQLSASNYPSVAFRYCTAVEGVQRWQGIFGQDPPKINVTEATQGQTVLLTINASKPLFQPQPFVALRDAFGQYTNITSSCTPVGSNSWSIVLPVPRNQLAKVGIAATDPAGNLATRILRYLPDDFYLDNLDPQYAELQGRWTSITNAAWGTDARVAQLGSNDTAQVRWSLPISRPGFYCLSVQVPAVTDAVGNTSFRVYAGASNVFSAVFAEPLPGNQWVQLGSLPLDPTLTNSLEMVVSGTNQPGTWAVADVVKIVPLPDTNAPVIVCNSNIVIDCAGPGGATVAFSVRATDDSDPDPIVTCEPSSGSLFPIGTNLITCTATDRSGNSSTCNFTITVNQQQPPSILFFTNAVVTADANGQGLMPDMTDSAHIIVSDPCSSVTITQSLAVGTVLSAGTYPVVLGAFDTAGRTVYATNYVTVINPAAPVITQEPLSRTNAIGTDADFSVTASCRGAIAYQWYFNGTPLGGQTNATLTVADVQLDNSGGYSVVLASGAGSVTSSVAMLTVVPPCCPPQFNHLAISPTARGFLLLFTGEPGQTCEILRSTDLLAGWYTITTATVPQDGLLLYEDTTPALSGYFYRIAAR